MTEEKTAPDSEISEKEWALFRMSDGVLDWIREKRSFPEDILHLEFSGEPAVKEIARCKHFPDAIIVKDSLLLEEQK